MNKKVLIVLALMAVLLSGCVEKEAIKVGGLFALTGKWATGGVTEANFVRIAIDEINAAGGVNGQKLELVLEDDKCTGPDSVTAANKLIFQDNVKVILGPSCTPASLPVAPIANENKVFMMAATTTAKGAFDKFEYAFRTSPPATDAALFIGKVAAEKYGLKNVAIITAETEFGQSWSDEFAKSFIAKGGNIVLKESYPAETTDFKTIISKVAAKDVDGVFVSGQAPQDSGIVLKQMKELGLLDKVRIIGNPTTIDLEVNRISGNALPAGAFTVVAYADNPQLLQKYVNRFNEQPGFQFFYTAAMYDATYMLRDALLVCGENSECIKDYFTNLRDWQGTVAKWSFNAFGDPVLAEDAYREVRIVNNEKVYDIIS